MLDVSPGHSYPDLIQRKEVSSIKEGIKMGNQRHYPAFVSSLSLLMLLHVKLQPSLAHATYTRFTCHAPDDVLEREKKIKADKKRINM